MDNKLKHIKQTGFKTPENYFQNFENEVLNKISSIPKNNGFVVEPEYFKTLESKIMDSIEEESKVINLFTWKHLSYISGIAASVIIAINIFLTNENLSIDDIETASLEDYIETEIESNELTYFLDEETISLNNFSEVDLSETALENYLLNDTNIEDFITE